MYSPNLVSLVYDLYVVPTLLVVCMTAFIAQNSELCTYHSLLSGGQALFFGYVHHHSVLTTFSLWPHFVLLQFTVCTCDSCAL